MREFIKYLPVSDTEKNWGFYVTSAGHKRVYPNETYPDREQHPVSHAFNWKNGRVLQEHNLVFIANGQGVFETKTSSQQITEGTVFFLFPGVWHRYKPDKQSGWEEYWIGFNGNYPETLMNKGFFNREHPFIHTGHDESLQSLLHQLIEKVDYGNTGYQQIASGIALQILGLLHTRAAAENNQAGALSASIEKAKFLIMESVADKIDMHQLARKLTMGYSNFRKQFKKEMGLSPNQYLLDIRDKKAKELLTSTDLNINEIAYRTGFESIYHFSKFFKLKNKISPSSFRLRAALDPAPGHER
jgi:AraC-like DNA-binding protein